MRDLLPARQGPNLHPQQLTDFLSGHPYVGVRTAGGESYIEYDNGEKEYYDLAVDPWQLQSAHDAPENAERLSALSATLSVLEDCEGAGCRTADGGGP